MHGNGMKWSERVPMLFRHEREGFIPLRERGTSFNMLLDGTGHRTQDTGRSRWIFGED
jgi:hypothetical protein